MAALSQRETPPLAPYNVSLMPFSPVFKCGLNSCLCCVAHPYSSYGVFRDFDPTIGWNASYSDASYVTAENDLHPSGIAYRRTQAAHESIAFTFQGTGMYLCLNAGGAPFALTLDGKVVETTRSAADDPACKHASGEVDTLLYARGLSYGPHSVSLNVSASAEHEFRFFGGALEIGVQTGGKIVDDSQMIDDQDCGFPTAILIHSGLTASAAGWVLSPGRGEARGWSTTTAQRVFNSTATFECTYGQSQSAAYTFSGAGGAVLLGSVWPDAHTFSVKIDDADPINLSATSHWYDGSAVFFIASGLDPTKEHTITVRNFNSDVLDCTSNPPRTCCTGIDAIRLLRAGKEDLVGLSHDPPQDPYSAGQPQSPIPGATGKSSTPIVAGSIAGTVAAIIIIAALVFLLRRRRGRNERKTIDGRPPMSDELKTLGPGRDALTPYTAVSSGIALSGSVVAVDGRKQRIYAQPKASQTNASQPSMQNAANTIPFPRAPPLAHEDLEQVLAFVAERMDPTGRARLHESDELPHYRG
ncbi:hypothetical protein AURDEDRAFT_128184 [Auricularia subglabra TFB-10046 SS5]|uniref:Transmembrane protein n=1 Tax=Auricularia subglabra (strain TFB-10046 / SS5) TaxID=717982 RepID=J0WXD0_AURST|nr:hypothetical protein AURDEDRAFT_128184 [Auricularia subglabra TFB-10046 SS5]